jgi:hypothetical protein
MRTPKNRLHDLEQKLQHRPVQKETSAQGKKYKPAQSASVEATSFDNNEPIDLRYDQEAGGYVPSSPTYATAHSLTPDLGSDAEAFEIEPFGEIHPVPQADTNSPGSAPVPSDSAGFPARAFEIDTPVVEKGVSVPDKKTTESEDFLENLQAISKGEKTYDGDRKQVIDVSTSAPKTETETAKVKAEPSLPPIQAEVVSPATSSIPTKSAAPPAQAFEIDTPAVEKASAPDEVVTEDDFLEDLQAILNGEKTYDGDRKQAVNTPTSAPTVEQLSVPPSPSPAPIEPPKQTSPHDVFDRMAQGVPPEPKAPTSAPTYSNAHSVFDRMGKNMAFANSFDLGTISLQQRFDEFDRILEAEEKGQSQSKAAAFNVEAHSLASEDESPDTQRGMSRPFAKEQEKAYAVTYVITWGKSKEAGIHKYLPDTPDVVRSGGIFGTGIAVRVPFGKAIEVDWKREPSDRKYVWCRYNSTEGYINKAYILGPSTSEETLRQILNSPILVKGLEAYLKREHATENLEFLLDLENLQNISGADQVPLLNEILITYVVPALNNKQVNLPNIQFDQRTRRIKAPSIRFDQIIEEQPRDPAQYVETMEPLLSWASETIIQLLAKDKLPGFIKNFSSTDIQQALKGKVLKENLASLGLSDEESDNHTVIAQSLSNSEYSEPFSITTAYVIEWRKPKNVGIHKYQSGNPDVVRSGGIFGTGIAARVPFGKAIQVDWERKASDPKYVWCKYKGTEGYINKNHILELKRNRETINRILDCPVLLVGFEEFTKKEFSTENLNFLLSLKGLEEVSEEEKLASLNNLIRKYILLPASNPSEKTEKIDQKFSENSQEINLPDKTKKLIKQRFDAFHAQPQDAESQKEYFEEMQPLLEKAREDITQLMVRDTIMRFIPQFSSDAIQTVMKNEVKELRAERRIDR